MRRNTKRALWIAAALALAGTAAGCGVETGREPIETQIQPPQTETMPETDREETTAPKEPETTEAAPEIGEIEGGKRVLLMTDMHYLDPSLTDGGSAFQTMVEHGDGKLVNYIEEIIDAAFDEAAAQDPDVLILSGDLTLNGEKESHKGLAKKLKKLEKRGVTVAVIPGNHDINNPNASGFEGDGVYPAGGITAKEFESIYWDFGYGESYSRDSHSLSYTYDLDDEYRLLMLDTCQYDPVNKVGGFIDTDTYYWIEQQLEEAEDEGLTILPVAHHNLLDESEIYVRDCTIEHSSQLIDLLESYNISLFLSGHLHVQHFMQNKDIGIYEIVTSSLATPPCQYGVLEYGRDGSFSYRTRQVDMEGWAKAEGIEDENLLSFKEYNPKTLKQIFYNQAWDAMKRGDSRKKDPLYRPLTEKEREDMCQVYSELNTAWYAGRAVEVVEAAKEMPGYPLWQEYCYPLQQFDHLEMIVRDAVKDYNSIQVD